MGIPVVDLADFLSGDPQRKQSFVQQLGKAYEDVGFVAVKNHGIPDDLIADLYKYVQRFFSLPSDAKKSTRYQDWPGSAAIHLLEKNTPKAVTRLI
jgi:isopenicillin N synthase-like dioxygenase